jgi:hypothetical protein
MHLEVMYPRVSTAMRVLARAAAVICLCVSVVMAMIAYNGSKETGGGAAQGDLGFFMILAPITAVVVGVTLLAVWIDRSSARHAKSSNRSLLSVLWISAAAWCVLAWNWFYLWFIWRV